MVTFTAAMLQSRQTAVFLHLLSSLVHSLRLLACLIPSLIACRFSTAMSPRCSNFPPAIHNIHAIYNDLFNLEYRRLLLLRVLHQNTGVNFKADATTTQRASTPFHLVDFISNDGRQVVSFRQLRYRPSSHFEVPPHLVPSYFFLDRLLSNITQHYKLFQLTTR
jgi:hypothetical protein